MKKFYCKYCGISKSNIAFLSQGSCPRHPYGKGKHKLYEGSEKSKYSCKYCGIEKSSINILTQGSCPRHPDGPSKGRHSPSL